MDFNFISMAGQTIIGTTSVFIKGTGILLLQLAQAPYFGDYEKVSGSDFTLNENQVYTFEMSEKGIVNCSKELPINRESNKEYNIKKNDIYKITEIKYISQFKENQNKLAENVKIEVAENQYINIVLDSETYGLSIKERIDLLENCL